MSNRKSIQNIQTFYGLPKDMKAFARGNSKLPATTLIVNHTTATHCPAAKFCPVADKCYARKCERIYKEYLAKNIAMERFYDSVDFDAYYALIVEYIHDYRGNLLVDTLRLNEAGDFKNQAAVDFFSRIADKLKSEYNIVTYAYTCRVDLNFKDASFIVNASRPEVNRYDHIFRATDKSAFKALPAGSIKCVGNCKKCNLCSRVGKGQVIYCKIH